LRHIFYGTKNLRQNIGIAYNVKQVNTMSSQVAPKVGGIIPGSSLLLGEWCLAKTAKARGDSIGQRITQCRKTRGMTQKELAEQLGVSQPVVSDYENDVIRMPADVVIALARILGVSADDLLGIGTNKPQDQRLQNRRLFRRLKDIDKLPKRDQEALLRTIDAFLAKTG
jgi:transcriptional regulator with XRE-family HTH domain